jgi:hypothetical protein
MTATLVGVTAAKKKSEPSAEQQLAQCRWLGANALIRRVQDVNLCHLTSIIGVW